MTEGRSWKALRDRRLREAKARNAYDRAHRAHELGKSVRDRRMESGLSQRELAEKIGTTQSAVARVEAGAVLPTIETLARIATALGSDLRVELCRKRKRSA